MRYITIFMSMLLCLTAFAQDVPADPESKRHWDLAQYYLDEDATEYAISELSELIAMDNYAPAYLKLIELCYATGKSKYKDYADSITEDFLCIWPESQNELNDVVGKAKAKDNIRMKKFYDSLIGNWHPEYCSISGSCIAMKIYRHNNRIVVDVPKSFYEVVSGWQTTGFIQWEGSDGLYIDRINSSYGETYGIDAGGDKWYVQIYIPFEQPGLADGVLRIRHRSLFWKEWLDWVTLDLIKD